MNALTRPLRSPERTTVQRLINDAGRLVELAFELGSCTSADEAEKRAVAMEESARAMDAASVPPSNEIDRMLALDVAGDSAWRARLFRARARELRS
jgi:hypothetical protein